MTARQRQPPNEPPQGSPEQFPVPPPPGFQAADHSWVLQSIMEMQKSLGALAAHIETLTKSQDKISDKVDKLSDRLHSAEKKLYAAGLIILLILAFMPKVWDTVLKFWPNSPPTSTTAPSQPAPTSPPVQPQPVPTRPPVR